MGSGDARGPRGGGPTRKSAARKSSARKKTGRRKAAGSRARRGASKSRRDSGWLRRGIFVAARILAVVAFGVGIWVSGWVLELDRIVVSRFEGRQFMVPSKVLSAPAILYPGLEISLVDLRESLERLGYREQTARGGRALEPGMYKVKTDRLRVHLRDFEHPSRSEPAHDIVLRFAGNRIAEIRELPRSSEMGAVLLEPELVGAYFGSEHEQRELVRLEDVPRSLIDAILAVEDRRFETHHGVDPRRIGGAMLANLRAGGVRQGGSTLTQQLVKNFFLTPERTLTRKAQEAAMSIIVEARYSKPEILESYLNEIYLGHRGGTSIHGVGEASRFLFGKPASELSTAESALIAAIIQSPNRLSPHRNPDAALARRNLVLELMRKQGRIELEEFNDARAQPIAVATVAQSVGEPRYFLDVLRRQLPEVYDQELLQTEGLQIYSTLDPFLQRAATRALQSGLEEMEKLNPALMSDDPTKRLQGCLVAMRPQTGEIVALVGGRSYGDSQYDRCTQARRPAGSVFKPFVYLAGLEPQGGDQPVVTLASRLDDVAIEIETRDGVWRPENYDKEFRGPVSLRSALERSLNVPAVRLAMRVGIDRVAEMAHRLGIKSSLPRYPSLALGAADLAPIEIARAYGTLANGGVRATPHTFEDVVSSGRTLERRTMEFEPVLDPGVAFLGVSLMQGVVDRGTGKRIRAMGLEGQIAGKTGTTDDERDLWFVGFTPELVAVVWVGFDEPRSIGISSTRGPLPIWARFIKEGLGDHVRGVFLPPGDVRQLPVDPTTGALAASGCPERENEYFLIGTEPDTVCVGRGREIARTDEFRARPPSARREGRADRGSEPETQRVRGIFGWIRERLR